MAASNTAESGDANNNSHCAMAARQQFAGTETLGFRLAPERCVEKSRNIVSEESNLCAQLMEVRE